MEKSFEFFSLDDHLKERMRKGPEYQVGQYCFPLKFTVVLECILTGLKLDSKRNQNIFAFECTLIGRKRKYIFQGLGGPGKGDI